MAGWVVKCLMKKKNLKLVAAGAALSILAGCIVQSVYPFYTAKDLVFDPALTGHWQNAKDAGKFWQFDAVGGKYYLLTTTEEQDTNGFEAHLFQLNHYQFLDLLYTNRSMFQMPLHLISKVTRTDTNVSLQFLDYGWLTSVLETNPAVLRHIIVPENANDTNTGNMLFLTADTKDLQKFLLKHVEDTNAFSSGSTVELIRAAQ